MLAIVDLPEPDRPVSHTTPGRWLFSLGAGRLVDPDVLPVDVVRAPQREVQQAGTDRVLGELVDDDEPAGVAVVGVRVERDRAIEAEVADADLVELERVGGEVLEAC